MSDFNLINRQLYQGARVRDGLRSGQLSPQEAWAIQQQRFNVNQQIRNDRPGMTGQEWLQHQQQLNGLSRQIFQDRWIR